MASFLHRRSDVGNSQLGNLAPAPASLHPQTRGTAAAHTLFSKARVSLQMKCLIALGTLCMVAFLSQQKRTAEEEGDGHVDRHETIVFPVYSRYPYSLEASLNIAMQKQTRNSTIDMEAHDISSSGAARKLKAESVDWIIYGRAASYYVKLIIGGKPYYLVVDTGSWMTWVVCKCAWSKCISMRPDLAMGDFYELDDVTHVVPQDAEICRKFQSWGGVEPEPPDAYSEQPCFIKIQYGLDTFGLETNMLLARDWMSFPLTNTTTSKLLGIFGCAFRIVKNNKNLMFDSNGIMGLDRSNMTIPAQLQENEVINNVVGHCLETVTCDFDPDTFRQQRVQHGDCQMGYLFMGDNYIETTEGTNMLWADLDDSPVERFTCYVVKAHDFRYGRSPISYAVMKDSPISLIFDSGSATSHISSKIFSHLLRAVDTDAIEMGYTRLRTTTTLKESLLPRTTVANILSTFKNCWIIPRRARNIKTHPYKLDFKDLLLKIGDSTFRISPLGYMLQMKPQVLCFAIYETQSKMSLIGALALRGYMFVYDNVKGRIGWKKERTCDIEQFKKILKTRKRPYIDI